MGKTFSDLADYLDNRVAEAEAPVKEYFEEHPYQAQVVLSSQQGLVQLTMPFPIIDGLGRMVAHPADAARGFADMFRVGTGTADALSGGSPVGVFQRVGESIPVFARRVYRAQGAARPGISDRRAAPAADAQLRVPGKGRARYR